MAGRWGRGGTRGYKNIKLLLK